MHTIDLHMHSRYSEDGEYAPAQLAQMCADAGIRTMAVSDHNTVAGVAEAIAEAERLKMTCTPAIEIDCRYDGVDFHVLGYDIDYKSADFSAIEDNVRKQCRRVSIERLPLINRLGFALTEQDLARLTEHSYWPEYWTGEVFAEALLNDPKYDASDLLKPYRPGGERSDNPYVNFYWDYCSQGKPCHAELAFPALRDIIDLIHDNRGKAVLAHPGVNLKGRRAWLDRLIALGLDGLEAFSSYHDAETARWLYNKARENNLSVTSGSDFHGKTKPSIQLGQYTDI